MSDWCDIRRGCINSREYYLFVLFLAVVFYFTYLGGFTKPQFAFAIFISLLMFDRFPKQLQMHGTRLIIAIVNMVMVLVIFYCVVWSGEPYADIYKVVSIFLLVMGLLLLGARFREFN